MTSAHAAGVSAARTWHPKDENNTGSGIQCVAWWDALEPQNVITSGKLETLYNKISGATCTQATAGVRFGYSATGMNNKPAFTGDGVSTQRISTTEAAVFAAYTNHQANTLITLVQYNGTGHQIFVNCFDNTGAKSYCRYGRLNSPLCYYAERAGDISPFFATRFESATSNTSSHVHAWTYDGVGFAVADGSGSGSDVKHHLDGSASVDSALGGDLNYDRDNLSPNAVQLGNGSLSFDGAWAAIILYKGVVSNAGIARAKKFLYTRQGL